MNVWLRRRAWPTNCMPCLHSASRRMFVRSSSRESSPTRRRRVVRNCVDRQRARPHRFRHQRRRQLSSTPPVSRTISTMPGLGTVYVRVDSLPDVAGRFFVLGYYDFDLGDVYDDDAGLEVGHARTRARAGKSTSRASPPGDLFNNFQGGFLDNTNGNVFPDDVAMGLGWTFRCLGRRIRGDLVPREPGASGRSVLPHPVRQLGRSRVPLVHAARAGAGLARAARSRARGPRGHAPAAQGLTRGPDRTQRIAAAPGVTRARPCCNRPAVAYARSEQDQLAERAHRR